MLSAVDDENHIGWIETRNGISAYAVSGCRSNLAIPDIKTLRIDPELNYLLRDVLNTTSFMEKLTSVTSFKQLASVLQKYVHEEIGKGKIYLPLNDNLLPQAIMNQLHDVGWGKVVNIAEDFTTISLQHIDFGGRVHEYEVYTGPGFPQTAPIINAHLPCPIHINWSQYPTPSIKIAVDAVEEIILKLQPLFEVRSQHIIVFV